MAISEADGVSDALDSLDADFADDAGSDPDERLRRIEARQEALASAISVIGGALKRHLETKSD